MLPMRLSRSRQAEFDEVSGHLKLFFGRRLSEIIGIGLIVIAICIALALVSWSVQDPSFNQAVNRPVSNLLGRPGAMLSDIMIQLFGLGAMAWLAPLGFLGFRLMSGKSITPIKLRIAVWIFGGLAACAIISALPIIGNWPLPIGLGGITGDAILNAAQKLPAFAGSSTRFLMLALLASVAFFGLIIASGIGFGPREDQQLSWGDTGSNRNDSFSDDDEEEADHQSDPNLAIVWLGALFHGVLSVKNTVHRWYVARVTPDDPFSALHSKRKGRMEPGLSENHAFEPDEVITTPTPTRTRKAAAKPAKPAVTKSGELDLYTLPSETLLAEAKKSVGPVMSSDALEQNARLLEGVLEDFGVRGEIVNVRPGPVVTLYELEPAPGIKSSRVIGLADDIARSMSAISARVAVVPGRNAIGIELPNQRRETVYLRELISQDDFGDSQMKLALALGKTIGGEPVMVDLARMPHLLVAGTTGSGKSVAINTMILSLLYRLKPEQCRLIMVDPKMLELSVYDGIPHLLTPVVTDPRKAVVALKWAVREMEERYKKMSKLGVRNIDGFNARVTEAAAKGETITRTVQTGFDRDTGEAIFEDEIMKLEPIPYIVVIVDEMADLMMVAGKDIEGAIQRLAQMARAAGIHVVLATQRPSVDVITGTIKANFPTRISFQVTSKIDSRTILGEQGAEQLLGQGDMLFMAGGGRISRVHGPFVSDGEVEKVVAHLKAQGRPNYLDDVTREDQSDLEDGANGAVFDQGSFGSAGQDPYDQAVAIVLRDRKASTSYIQRRLQIGYNRAASIMERMEDEGVVGQPNHAGKREILIEARSEGGRDFDGD
jgi:S-DNA-T family DNA segregation ATPase FtsK/SpoIIIE